MADPLNLPAWSLPGEHYRILRQQRTRAFGAVLLLGQLQPVQQSDHDQYHHYDHVVPAFAAQFEHGKPPFEPAVY